MRKSKSKSKNLRILVPMHVDLVPPESIEGLSEADIQPWKTEYDVTATLHNMGHELIPVGLYDDLGVIHRAIENHAPQLAFNLLEEFHGDCLYEQHLASYFELKKLPYTGCNPRGLTLAHDKALSKKVLAYDQVSVPRFGVFPIGRKVRRPAGLNFPLFVKSLVAEGSVGISQASIVRDERKLADRVEFIHRQTHAPAIAEQYIEGREIYVGIIGNDRLETLTPWELFLPGLPNGAPRIATDRIKWDYKYQRKVGVRTGPAELTKAQVRQLADLSKRIYRSLCLSGYARLDFRMDAHDRFHLLEANPNPNLSFGEDFAEAAEHVGYSFPKLLQKIIDLGFRYQPGVN